MEEKEKMYCGSGCKSRTFDEAYSVELDLTQLWEAIQGPAKKYIREWTDKGGTKHKTIRLDMFELKPGTATQYRTHSLKISTYEKAKQEPARSAGGDNDFPF